MFCDELVSPLKEALTQGQGIMQEAPAKVIAFGLDVIGLKTIEAYTHPENDNSSKLLRKFKEAKRT
jgi:[ribosomal protein S5]-alanine N-acetyltransferase